MLLEIDDSGLIMRGLHGCPYFFYPNQGPVNSVDATLSSRHSVHKPPLDSHLFTVLISFLGFRLAADSAFDPAIT